MRRGLQSIHFFRIPRIPRFFQIPRISFFFEFFEFLFFQIPQIPCFFVELLAMIPRALNEAQ